MNTNSEVKKTRDLSQSVGARRLRRFTARMVLGVRESQAWWTLKRPEGRAPFAASRFNFGFRDEHEPGRTVVCALGITHISRTWSYCIAERCTDGSRGIYPTVGRTRCAASRSDA